MAQEANARLLKNFFEHTSCELRSFKNDLLRVEEKIARLNAGPQNEFTNLDMESQLNLKRVYESSIRTFRSHLVLFYKHAIRDDVDVDGSRLLSIYRFFYRNRAQLHRQLALINVPRGSYAVWGIIILTAIMYLYAAV